MARLIPWLGMVVAFTTPVGAAGGPGAGAEAKAREFVLALSRGETADLAKGFDAAMIQAMPPARLSALWAQLLSQLMGFKGIKGTSHEKKGSYLTTRVHCEFELMPMDILVVFDAQGLISGLRVVPPQVSQSAPPQTPKPPFPYTAEEVLYSNPTDGSQIGGTLTIPPGVGPHPAVLLITGSGQQDRDVTIFGHKPFWVIADHLSRHGIAVLRVDDRGVGTSTGDPKNSTIQIHATDVEASVAFLGTRNEIDGQRIGLAGHSEGGIIAPIVAARNSAVAFIVLMGGSGVTGAEINIQQVTALLPEHTKERPAAREAVIRAQGALMAALAKGSKEAELKVLLNTAIDAGLALMSESDRAAVTPKTRAAQLEGQLQQLTSPWFRSFVSTDPAEALAKVKVPVLALIGEKDLQVPAGPNLAAIGAALRAGGHSDFELHALPSLNHLFQTAETGRISEYGQIEETFNPGALALMTKWVRAKARLDTPPAQ